MYKMPYVTLDKVSRELSDNGLLTKPIKIAIEQAVKSHILQKRDSGQPYLEEHIFPIVMSVISKYKNESFIDDLLQTCILHDVIEDDENVSRDELINTFGNKIVSNVLYLTKTAAENAHGLPQVEKAKINHNVLERLKNAPTLVQIAKLEDRLSNISCIEKMNNPKFIRYVQETKESYVPFAKYVNQPLYVELLNNEIKRLS